MPGITGSRKARHRDYGLVRRMPDGSLQPLGLPVWRWDTFYIEIVRSIFDGAWDSDAAGARAVNYWWGMRSGAEEIDYSKDPPPAALTAAGPDGKDAARG